MRTKGELKKAFPTLRQLIDSLWRNYYGLYRESYLDPPDLDELGEPIDPWQKNRISRDIRHGQALGQDNLIEGNRSAAFGQGNNTKSFLEIILGANALIPEGQNPEEWIPTDMLLTLGNGPDPENRSNVFVIFKNGLIRFQVIPEVWIEDHFEKILTIGDIPEPDTITEETENYTGEGIHTHKLEIPTKGITEIVKTIIDNNHQSYLIENTANVEETVVSTWTVIPYNEQVGEFKAVVMVRNKALNTIITVMSILSFDYSDPVKVVHQNPMLTDIGITLTVGVDSGTSKLYATVSGMSEDNKRIHLCFERCVLGQRFTEISATIDFVLDVAATLSSYLNMTAVNEFTLDMSANISSYKKLTNQIEMSLGMNITPSIYKRIASSIDFNLSFDAVLTIEQSIITITLSDLFPRPVAIANEEVNSFTVGTLITITAIDTVNHTITLSWLPPYSSLETPASGKNWIVGKGDSVAGYSEPNVYGQEQAYLQILSGNLATKTLTYNPANLRALDHFTVGANVYLYNIFNSGLEYNSGISTPLIPVSSGTYYSYMTGSGAVWKHSDNTFRMALNGNNETKWQVGLWSSSNLINWTFQSATPLLTTSPGTWRADHIQVNCIIKNPAGGFIAYCWGQQSGIKTIGWCKFDENMENVTYSANSIVTNPPAFGCYNPNVIFFNGEFRMLLSARLGEEYNLNTTPWEVWECYAQTPEGPFVKRAAILNTTSSSIRNLTTCYRSSHSTSFAQFLLNGKLCAFIDGTSRWNNSANRGEREFGLIYFDETDSTWKDHEIGIIVASYQYANSIWNLPEGHLGGTPTIIKHNNKLYIFTAATQSTDRYQTVLHTFESYAIDAIVLPQEIDIPNSISVKINTVAPTVVGAITIPTSSTTLATDCVALYEMNEVSGTVLNDSISTKNGTIQTGIVLNQTGKIGAALRTDPTTNAGYLTIPHHTDFNPKTGNYSINIWIKYTGGSSTSIIAGVINKGETYSGGEVDLVLRFGGGASYKMGFYFRLRDSVNTNDISPSIDKTSVIQDGNWHMLTLVVNRTASPQATCYLDGASVGTLATVTANVNPTTLALEIGRYTATYPMRGFIDQTAFWKKALTTTEISALYNSGSGLAGSAW